MAKSKELLTTKEFSQKAGVSPATVSNWLKKGKIEGKKQGTKWLIAASELKKTGDVKPTTAIKPTPARLKSAPKKKKAATKTTTQTSTQQTKPAASGKAFTVEAFSDMTYLTTYGVKRWLKEGRLTGRVDASGQMLINATNLNNAHVKRILR